jgi:eukaryotic-like serine/threonine-protein kinase
MSLTPGTRIGPYEIQSAIGAGGMGEVYRARDTSLGRDVAIKVLPDTFAGDPERVARFEMEARTLAALNHPNIAQIYGLEKAQGQSPLSALVMELVEGETLRARISQGPLAPRKALEIAIALAEALSVVHAKGITHRDLKPENIFLTADGRIKVLDFGLARWIGPEPRRAFNTRCSSILRCGSRTIGMRSRWAVRAEWMKRWHTTSALESWSHSRPWSVTATRLKTC